MNLPYVRYILGRELQIFSVLLLPALAVSLVYQNSFKVISAILSTVLLSLLTGTLLSWRKPKREEFYAKEGLLLVAITFIVYSFLGALPFYFSGEIPFFVDCLFESVSGFTTTGASILGESINSLSEGLMFWRSFTLLIGGMGILVFLLYILPNFSSKGIYIMRAELPGPTFGKLESRLSDSIHILYMIYLFLTGLLTVLLRLAGLPWFEALLLSMGASGSGGFNIYSDSIAHYHSEYVELIMTLAMFIFGINFNLFYDLYRGRWRKVVKDEGLRWYIGILGCCAGLIALNIFPLYQVNGLTFIEALKDSLFNVTSINSTTAYSNTDISVWPITSHVILLFLMFCGAMSGSTTSGLKIERVAIFIKSIRQEIRRTISPNRVTTVTFNGKVLEDKVLRSVSLYLMTYLGVFMVILTILSLDSKSFAGAFNATIATLNNIGSSLDLLGPSESYEQMSAFSKLIMCVSMWMGRLEIYPILILFSRSTWKKT